MLYSIKSDVLLFIGPDAKAGLRRQRHSYILSDYSFRDKVHTVWRIIVNKWMSKGLSWFSPPFASRLSIQSTLLLSRHSKTLRDSSPIIWGKKFAAICKLALKPPLNSSIMCWNNIIRLRKQDLSKCKICAYPGSIFEFSKTGDSKIKLSI